MAPEFFVIRTFLIGFFLGIFLFFILYKIKGPDSLVTIEEFHVETINFQHDSVDEVHLKDYDVWFKESGFKKQLINNDELRYTKINGEMESDLLYKSISLICVIYTSNLKSAKAINETWSSSCNKIMYYSKQPESNSRIRNKFNTSSSFHLLCDAVRGIVIDHPEIEWAVFVKDDMFVISENLRRLVAPLNPDEGHYLGHAINFWGVEYNMAIAGFILSRRAMKTFTNKFSNTSSCMAGGKYWKQEDMYLGKHLTSMGIKPVDTRDKMNYTLFLGYDLDKMMFPGSFQHFTTFSTRALYPVKCCGPNIISFPVLSSTEMYTYYYMIYTMGVFESGRHGNKPHPTTVPDYQVWQEFLQSEGHSLNVSNSQYEEIWYRKIGNTNIVRPDKPVFNLGNMPDVLEYMLYNFTSKRSAVVTDGKKL